MSRPWFDKQMEALAARQWRRLNPEKRFTFHTKYMKYAVIIVLLLWGQQRI